jgi:aryl-alcohol dehydrogenase-like predicted oxidoreductase
MSMARLFSPRGDPRLMQQTVISGTSLHVSRFSYGTASLHHIARSSERLNLLLAAVDAGFSHFDTSPLYGFGLAEMELGRLIKYRKEVSVGTKIGLYAPGGHDPSTMAIWMRKAAGKLVPRLSRAIVNWSLDAARTSLERSLRRLGRHRVDVLFLHEPVPTLVDADEWLMWMELQHTEGKVLTWGMAGNSAPMHPWITSQHEIGKILQVKDSLARREADGITAAGRPLQFTYGYFSDRPQDLAEGTGEHLRQILARNSTGSVIVSTRRVGRLERFAEAAR